VSFSQTNFVIKYPYVQNTERGKEWVFTPRQTDSIIGKIKREKELVSKLRLGADRRDSIIYEYTIQKNDLNKVIVSKDIIIAEQNEKFKFASDKYYEELRQKYNLEVALKREKRRKNFWKIATPIVAVGGIVTGILIK
jgi:hypothetical protein